MVPLTGQERAWTSPIWYTPSAEARKNAQAGMTVADLKKKGAAALNDAQLKALIVGKAHWLRNNVTGEQFWQSFTAEGQTTLFRIGTNASVPSGYGNVERDGYQGTTSPYEIEGGKLITFVSQDPYAFTFYKLGDTYYAARSNEFGYANYEIVPDPKIAINPLTEVVNQFSITLGLTEQQRQQVVPILEQELKQLEALKKDASLSAVRKVERLREIGNSFDERLKPLINPEQQQKFQALREQLRRRFIETMARKVETEVKAWFTEKVKMPEQRERRGKRAMTRWFFAALFLCASSVASACPLCLGAFRSSVAQQLVNLPHAVLAQPSADGRGYRVVAVIKGEQPAGGIIPADAISA